MEMDTNKPIIFFDGVCGLCNTFVDFVLRHDKKQVFLFAQLKGETFAQLAKQIPQPVPDSVVLLENGNLYFKSEAALKILLRLGGLFRLAAIAYLTPKPVRSYLYDAVARNRYHWFGKKETCRLPSPDERARFLS
jgi:predicted DCC family thiol-disulfide oxidoreductase YuxK